MNKDLLKKNLKAVLLNWWMFVLSGLALYIFFMPSLIIEIGMFITDFIFNIFSFIPNENVQGCVILFLLLSSLVSAAIYLLNDVIEDGKN